MGFSKDFRFNFRTKTLTRRITMALKCFHVGGFWRPRRAQDAPKTLSKRCWSWSSILQRFWSDFLPNLALKIDQNRRKIEVKTPSISTSIFWWFFVRFGIDFWRFFATKTEPIWHQIHWKINANFERPIFKKTYKHRCFYNVFLGFRRSKLGAKIEPKSITNLIKNGAHLGIDVS